MVLIPNTNPAVRIKLAPSCTFNRVGKPVDSVSTMGSACHSLPSSLSGSQDMGWAENVLGI